jgi:4-alpha-glucanotransferase
MIAPNLLERAQRLGAAPTYIDASKRPRTVSESALSAVCDLLDSGGPSTSDPEHPYDPVVLVRGGTARSGIAADDVRVVVEIDFDAGGSVGPSGITGPDDLGSLMPFDRLPVGIHTLRWERNGESGESTLLVAPEKFPMPPRVMPGIALFAPAYSIWSEADPFPSYDNLPRLGTALSGTGAATLATLPLYAPGLGADFQASPYSPTSRFHWNELFVPDRLLEASSADAPQLGDHIDWPAVLDVRTHQLRTAAQNLPDLRRQRLAAFLSARPDVTAYADWASRHDPSLHDAFLVGQFLAERALADVATALEGRGQTIALDLPVGAREDSWETATWPALFVAGATIGAPPDRFFTEGQNWALPPLSPTTSRRDGHRVWAQLLRSACRFAGVLRIDHVMQVFRLWWIPPGHSADDGVYVHYPADELLAVAAIVAHQTHTTMVGEDLGTVPDSVVELLADWGLPGMYEEGFTLHDWAPEPTPRPGDKVAPTVLPAVPKDAWVGIRTHDMPAFAATADELDVARYREALAAELGEDVPAEGEPGSDGQFVGLHDAMARRLFKSDAFEVVIDLDDVLGETASHNVPGTIADTNWSRRSASPVEALRDDERVTRTFSTMTRP